MSETISAIVWPILGAILTALAGVLAPILVKWAIGQLEKVHLTVSAERAAQLEYLAKQAILRAAELAAQQAKKGGAEPSGAAKLQIATADVTAKMDVTPAEASDAIHAALPQVGIGAWASQQKEELRAAVAKVAVEKAETDAGQAPTPVPFVPKAAGNL